MLVCSTRAWKANLSRVAIFPLARPAFWNSAYSGFSALLGAILYNGYCSFALMGSLKTIISCSHYRPPHNAGFSYEPSF